MKIVFLMDQMYLHGGAERILSQKMNYLIAHYGYEVHLVTSEQRGRNAVYELHRDLQWHDLGIDYERGRSYFSAGNLLKTMRHFLKLRRILGQIRPDAVVSVSYSPDQFFLPYLHRPIPKFKEFHSSRFGHAPTDIIRQLERAFGKYQKLVVLNADEVPFFPAHNTVVIPNFTTFAPRWVSGKEKIVIAAGRIAPVKQFGDLVEIWSRLHLDFPDWQLHIYGDGDGQLRADLQKQIDSYGIKNAHLFAATDAIGPKLQQAALYAMTSATECFPMVLLEAQACGLPIISYDCPTGPRHIVSDQKDGLLIAPGDRDAFSGQLRELMHNHALRESMGKKAVGNVTRFDVKPVMAMWDELFQKTKP